MKRNMELIRNILFTLEQDENPFKWGPVEINGYDYKEISYHLKLLYQAGLVEAKSVATKDTDIWWAKNLTWSGHEFLDSIRNDSVWKKTKQGIKEKGFELGSIPFEVLKEYAKIQLKQKFGIE